MVFAIVLKLAAFLLLGQLGLTPDHPLVSIEAAIFVSIGCIEHVNHLSHSLILELFVTCKLLDHLIVYNLLVCRSICFIVAPGIFGQGVNFSGQFS